MLHILFVQNRSIFTILQPRGGMITGKEFVGSASEANDSSAMSYGAHVQSHLKRIGFEQLKK